MEQRIISYTKGITRNPGELIAEDGELLECINLKCEGGELKPLLWPEKAGFALNDGEELLYIHKGSGYKNYFVGKSGTVSAFYLDESGVRKDYTFSHSFDGYLKFESIGNTLIVSCDDGLHYILFKNDKYKYLGQQFPECPLSFGLQGEFRTYSQNNDLLNVTHPSAFDYDENGIVVHKDGVESVTNQILGAVNKFIKDEATNKGKFMFPFFVRYAYRLYDGTLTYHSAPVLMVASSYYNPYVHVKSYNTDHMSFKCDISTVVSELDYQLVDTNVRNELKQWSDIIKSVDIFISSPIYTYNQNARVEHFTGLKKEELGNEDVSKLYDGCYFVGRVVGGDCGYKNGVKIGFSEQISKVTNRELFDKYQRYFVPSLYQMLRSEPVGQFFTNLSYPKDSVDERIKNCSLFYFVKSIKINALSSTRELIKIGESYLSSLESRERMTDEYRSHSQKYAGYMYSYNNRLHLSDVTVSVFKGFKPESLFQFTNGACKLVMSATANGDDIDETSLKIEDTSKSFCNNINVQIERNEDVTEVKSSASSSYDIREVGLYTYYPDTEGSSVIVGNAGVSNIGDYAFENHKVLNGTFNYQGLDRRIPTPYASFILSQGDFKDIEPNNIYTSEVNNPFVFPAGGVNTVGTGDVLGIVSTTKALSQGQFGQFPLLVLSTDGIWVMTVNDEGLYSTKQVLSRDVCNNADSIVQTDNLVFFSSERGLMAIDGANVVCVTEQMKGVPGTVQSLKRIGDILDKEEYAFVRLCDDGKEFKDFLKGCRIGYNYKDNSLYISNKEYAYIYVYDIRQGTFTKLCSADESSKVIGFVNDYPDTLMQESVTIKSTDDKGEEVTTQKTNVYSMIADHDLSATEPSYGFAMTRALKLGNPTGMKRIRQLKNLKNVVDADNYVKYALWGSNDGILWYNIRSYDGGFKYYRMGLFTKLAPSESVLGSVMAVEEKRNNKMR